MLTGRGTILMTGALRRRSRPDWQAALLQQLLYFRPGGELLGTYDKFHLVPFGEYLPFEATLGELGLSKLTGINGSFAHGDGPHTYNVPGAPSVGPLICYEILFRRGCGRAKTGLARQRHRRFVVRTVGRAETGIFWRRACAQSKRVSRSCVQLIREFGHRRPARANHGAASVSTSLALWMETFPQRLHLRPILAYTKGGSGYSLAPVRGLLGCFPEENDASRAESVF